MVVFTDDAWPNGEERTYLTWDNIEVLRKWKKVRTYELVEKDI
jgi:hypothetical protein